MKKIGCNQMAESIKALMTIANFSGYIKQNDGESLRQYDVTSITGDQDKATMFLDIAGQGFKLEIYNN